MTITNTDAAVIGMWVRMGVMSANEVRWDLGLDTWPWFPSNIHPGEE